MHLKKLTQSDFDKATKFFPSTWIKPDSKITSTPVRYSAEHKGLRLHTKLNETFDEYEWSYLEFVLPDDVLTLLIFSGGNVFPLSVKLVDKPEIERLITEDW